MFDCSFIISIIIIDIAWQQQNICSRGGKTRTVKLIIQYHTQLVGGFNPFEKYWSKWESSPNRGEHKNYLKPPPIVNYADEFSKSPWLLRSILRLCKSFMVDVTDDMSKRIMANWKHNLMNLDVPWKSQYWRTPTTQNSNQYFGGSG